MAEIYLLLVTLIALLCEDNAFAADTKLHHTLVPKEQTSEFSLKAPYPELENDPTMELCLENCKRKSQMAAMSIEAIVESCQHQCDLEKALQMTKSSDAAVKKEGTILLCELGDKNSVPVLITLLKEDLQKDTGVWFHIIPALGFIGDQRATEVFIELVNQDHWQGREMTARALGKLGDKRATPALIEAAWHSDTGTREAAVTSLAQLHDPRAAATFVAAIQSGEEQSIRSAATVGLLRLGSDAVPAINDEFSKYFRESPQTEKRIWLCDILGKIATKEALGVLKQSLDDQDSEVKACAKKYL
ncbi:MAG: hypothetical protein CSA32_02325 [Desulfobulbus propionicus]|nr:MAG: hypothetical protein CSA32_02325 [Desulfobulbus propionicus]